MPVLRRSTGLQPGESIVRRSLKELDEAGHGKNHIPKFCERDPDIPFCSFLKGHPSGLGSSSTNGGDGSLPTTTASSPLDHDPTAQSVIPTSPELTPTYIPANSLPTFDSSTSSFPEIATNTLGVPSVTSTPSVPASTMLAFPPTSATSSSAASPSSLSSATNAGLVRASHAAMIAGIVIGSFVLLSLIALAAYFYRRYRNNREAPSAQFLTVTRETVVHRTTSSTPLVEAKSPPHDAIAL